MAGQRCLPTWAFALSWLLAASAAPHQELPDDLLPSPVVDLHPAVAGDQSTAVGRGVKIPGVYAKTNGGVEFTLHSRHVPKEGQKLVLEARGALFPGFNPRLPTKVVIHGWLGNGGHWYSAQMKDALLLRTDVNVIVVDWSKHGSQSNYVTASQQVAKVARVVADFLGRLEREQRYPPERVHLLGHSLGAHICGIAGSALGGRVNRITGFDPAGVLYKPETKERLRRESAAFVDVIHSCTNRLGHSMQMGHVDFYPNGGTAGQPGCGSDITGTCSHSRAHEYYIDSLVSKASFPAAECENWEKFKKKECNFKKVNFIGEATNRGIHGKFFLETNDKQPFGRGFSWV